MTNIVRLTLPLLALVGGVMLLSSCAVTTESFEGTTETLENTTDATSDVTSSTSPRDEDHAQAQKIKAFARANLDRIREDAARGGGEHLASLGALLGVDAEHRSAFASLTKEKYPVLFSSEPTTAEELLARLDTELKGHPQLRP